MAAPLQLTRMHRVLIGVVVTGAVIIAGIGFAGSYAAVRELALQKGFGNFSYVFPIGIDAGICVLLALDLLLTWIRIPFPLLRQTAWLLTAATIAFNGAAAWPDPLGVGMHGVIPVLFVVSVEAARHAIGRIADITADKHMEGVRLTRWMLSPVPTFLLWRRMKLWELRSYEQVIKLEQERLVYQARLRSRFGRSWRRKAPVEALMPLRLAKYGVPLAETAPAGLAAAGIEPALLPPSPTDLTKGTPTAALATGSHTAIAPAGPADAAAGGPADLAADSRAAGTARVGTAAHPGEQQRELEGHPHPGHQDDPAANPWLHARDPQSVEYHGGYDPTYDPDEEYARWYAEQQQAEQYQDQFEEEPPVPEPSPEETGSFPIPVTPGRTRELGEGGGTPVADPDEEAYYQVFKKSINGSYPTPREFGDNVEAEFSLTLPPEETKRLVTRFTNRFNAELEEDHIA
ncbi:membrane protein [Streptomyces griseoloalbus]|nr:membrane protein [Streptomyces griseoloalbus]